MVEVVQRNKCSSQEPPDPDGHGSMFSKPCCKVKIWMHLKQTCPSGNSIQQPFAFENFYAFSKSVITDNGLHDNPWGISCNTSCNILIYISSFFPGNNSIQQTNDETRQEMSDRSLQRSPSHHLHIKGRRLQYARGAQLLRQHIPSWLP